MNKKSKIDAINATSETVGFFISFISLLSIFLFLDFHYFPSYNVGTGSCQSRVSIERRY